MSRKAYITDGKEHRFYFSHRPTDIYLHGSSRTDKLTHGKDYEAWTMRTNDTKTVFWGVLFYPNTIGKYVIHFGEDK